MSFVIALAIQAKRQGVTLILAQSPLPVVQTLNQVVMIDFIGRCYNCTNGVRLKLCEVRSV